MINSQFPNFVQKDYFRAELLIVKYR